ncbi:MAG: DUF4294 domain-containing protein, partial [Bacteroidales bacterium]|nr:DUF4294 domain-containing protein [Bacteroidales bacterium]
MNRHLYCILLLLLLPLVCPAQGTLMGYVVENNDTLFVGTLNPAYVFNRPLREVKDKNWGDYYRIVYNFNKAYPYALMASQKVFEIDSTIAVKARNGREREKMIKDFEK